MVLKGHEDLRPRKVYAFTPDGKLLIDDGNNGAIEYEMSVSPSGALHAHPPKPVPIDQELTDGPAVPVLPRWHMVDQPTDGLT